MTHNPAWKSVIYILVCFTTIPTSHLRQDRVCQASYDLINLGMTLEEVVSVLGRSGTDNVNFIKKPGPKKEVLNIQMVGIWEHRADDNDPGKRWLWVNRDGIIGIRLGQDGRVTDKMFMKLKPLGFLDHIHQWLAE